MPLPTPDQVLIDAGRAVRRHGRAALCQIVRADGSTPGKVGWKLVVSPAGECRGNLGGGAFEALVISDARAKLADPSPEPEVKRYYLTEEATRGEATGMVCGGLVEVLIEVMMKAPLLVICGGGPVGQAVAHAAALCGFDLRVVEDREEYLRPELFPSGTSLVEVTRDFEADLLEDSERQQFAVVVTRCWETDLAALAAVLRQRPPGLAYLGLMGSERKVERVRSTLAERGLDLGGVKLHAPIGMPIGGDTPAEIAISILAEIIACRSGAAASSRSPLTSESFVGR